MTGEDQATLPEQVRDRYAQAAPAVVAEDHLTLADRTAAGSYAGCIAGALSRREYLDGLAAAGFTDTSVTFTTRAAPGMQAAIIRAVKPAIS